MSTSPSFFARAARATLIAGVVGALAISTALAGRSAGASATSTFNVPDGTFASTTTATGASSAWVRARCYQGGVLVYEQYVKVEGGSATLTLGPTPSWSSGSATCDAQDGWFRNGTRWRVVATDTFAVSG